VLGSASLLEMRMCASEDRTGSRSDAICHSDLGCTWRITVTCHLSVIAKGFRCRLLDLPGCVRA